MSAYNYQGSAGYDSNSHESMSQIHKQPFRPDTTSLPPIQVRSSQAPSFPSSLLRTEGESHDHFSGSIDAVGHVGAVTTYPPQQSNYLAGHSLQSMSSAHSQLLSDMPGLPQSYGNYVPPATSAPYGQSARPSVASMYGQTAYPSSDSPSSRLPHYQSEDVKSSSRRMSRDTLAASDGNHLAVGSDGLAANASSLTGVKNAEGKWACTLCRKTYQHQKHLKRHNLRHTGERPYRCHLCHETFCRSDILKRHFQKCSVRRGNPQGVTHLTHAQDHLKKPKAEAAQHQMGSNVPHPIATSGIDSTLHSRPAWFSQSPMYSNFGSGLPSSTGSAGTATFGDSNGSSRSSSVPRPDSSGSAGEDRKTHLSALHPLPPMHAPDMSPIDSSRFTYDAPYMRTGYNPQHMQNNPEQTTAFYGHTANGGPQHYSMPQAQAFSQPGQASHYQNMAPMNGAPHDHWLSDPHAPFHSSSQDGLMYQSS